jgi:hypothetical protein
MLAFRVCSALSGDSFTVRMDIENFKIAVFKSSLSTFSGISPNDQILLIGPPYKVLDTHFSPDMCSNGQKIFMFDKRIMSEGGGEPQAVKLKPYAVPEPSPIDVPMSSGLAESSSPMLRAVPDYEKQFLSHIRLGETYLLAVEQSSVSCKRCLEQIEVQRLSLEAAVSNLDDHYIATKNSFENKQEKIIIQQKAHKGLLDSFDDNFQQLGAITLHPSLQALLTNGSMLSDSGGSDSGDKPLSLITLRDTIPVDKEFAWREKCKQSHQKVEENMAQLQIIFDKIALSMTKLGVQTECPYSLEQLSEFNASLETNATAQKHYMGDLRESYTLAAEEISSLLQCEEGEREGKITPLFTLLEASRKAQEQAIKPMEVCCAESMQIKDLFAETKTAITKNIYYTLRDISAVQTDIQFKLKKGMELMTRWRQGHNGYFQHLERIRSLPEAYATFLHEMIRRGKYTQDFEVLVKTSVDSISAFRSEETSQREKFMADMGSCLPPIFFDMVPSLVEKPPFFNATITDRQPIPDILLEEEGVRGVLESFGLLGLQGGEQESAEESTDSRHKHNIDNNYDSGATLTSSSSCDYEKTPSSSSGGAEDDDVESVRKKEGTADRNKEKAEREEEKEEAAEAKKTLQLEEKLKRLEEENRQLRRLASLNLQAYLDTEEQRGEGEGEGVLRKSQKDAPKTQLTPPLSSSHSSSEDMMASSSTSEPSGQETLNACLDSELVTLLLDVLELKESVSNCVPPLQGAPTAEHSATQSQLSEVAGLVQGIHSLSMCVKEDAIKMKQSRAERSISQQQGRTSTISKISFLQLNVGDIALFLPTNKKDTFLAFTYELPYYYLSQDSLANFKNQNGDPPNYIMGQIIFIDERIASKDVPSNIGSAQAPKILPPGMKYHLLEIEAVNFSSN